MLELRLQSGLLVQQSEEVIEVWLGHQEGGAQSVDYARYIESIHHRSTLGMPSGPFKN